MVSHAGGQVEVGIGMMHLMDTPQDRNPVKEAMHSVSDKIQQDHGDDEPQQEGPPGAIQQAVKGGPGAIQQSEGAFGNQHRDRSGAERNNGIRADLKKGQRSIAGPPECIRLDERSPGPKRLAQADQNKGRNEQPPSDTNFVAGEVLLH
jgi:hypothetical protein